MLTAFCIWTLASLLFLGFSVHCWSAKKAVGFFANAQPPEVSDIPAYNRAVARIWLVMGVLFELLGLPFLYAQQDSPIFIFLTLGVVFLMLGCIVAYVFTVNRYRKK